METTIQFMQKSIKAHWKKVLIAGLLGYFIVNFQHIRHEVVTGFKEGYSQSCCETE